MIVRIPSPLRSYTQQSAQVESKGNSLAEVLENLEKKHPGIKFRMIDEQQRIRRHIKIFVNTEPVDNLAHRVSDADTVHIICALSGG